mgnify:CR=1 FL=1
MQYNQVKVQGYGQLQHTGLPVEKMLISIFDSVILCWVLTELKSCFSSCCELILDFETRSLST